MIRRRGTDDGSQWEGGTASTAHIPVLTLATRREARQVVAGFAKDAAELESFLAMLDLVDIDGDIEPTEG